MDRQQFSKLVSQKLSEMTLDSLKFIDEAEDSLTVEVVSRDFLDMSVLKRINLVYGRIEELIKSVSFHVTIIPLTRGEFENDEHNVSKGWQNQLLGRESQAASANQ